MVKARPLPYSVHPPVLTEFCVDDELSSVFNNILVSSYYSQLTQKPLAQSRLRRRFHLLKYTSPSHPRRRLPRPTPYLPETREVMENGYFNYKNPRAVNRYEPSPHDSAFPPSSASTVIFSTMFRRPLLLTKDKDISLCLYFLF